METIRLVGGLEPVSKSQFFSSEMAEEGTKVYDTRKINLPFVPCSAYKRILKPVLMSLGLILCGILSSTAIANSGKPEVIRLWSDVAPGSEGFEKQEQFDSRAPADGNGWMTNVSEPTLTVYFPAGDARVGSGVVICPGGGYGGLSIEKEGYALAKWFAKRGVVAGVLKYRHGGGLHQHPVPLDDAQRALRIMRSQADTWKLDKDKIGIAGFSAGGHLASTAGTHFDDGNADSTDLIEQQSCRANFMVLVYPVISMKEQLTHKGSRRNLLGKNPDDQLVKLLSNELQVTPETCPAFITHAADDNTVSVDNALSLYHALLNCKVPTEMHLYETGGHGYGFYRGEKSADRWPDLLEPWLQTHKLID